MTVDAMMMMKSAATSRQPKSALIAAITPRTQSRITKPCETKHRVSALVGELSSQTRAAGAGVPVPVPVRAARLRTYSCTSDTTVAWLQVRGDTDSCALL